MSVSLPLLLGVLLAIVRDRSDLVAENLVLRQQLSALSHRNKRPKLRPFDRFVWGLLSQHWSRWRDLLVIVKPATVVGWHRQGFKLFWRWKSRSRRPGRPRLHEDVRRLIVQMARTNVGWGAPRIHGELAKLGIHMSESTVSKYMPKPTAPPGSAQRWTTFMRNHLAETLAIDFAVVPTINFELLFVFDVLSLERREVLHINVTPHPTAEWTAQQMIEACPFEAPARFLIRDNDKIYGAYFQDRVNGIGLETKRTAFRSPWQNGYVERWIAGLRRECLDHVIATNERKLRRVVRSYVEYFHQDRTHLGLDKDTPSGREVESASSGDVVAFPRLGGLHHRYSRSLRNAA